MKNFTLHLVSLVIVFGLGYWLGNRPIPIPEKPPITIIQYLPSEDSTPDENRKPEIIYQDTGSTKIKYRDVTIYINLPVDSAAIVADYLKVKYYTFDTIAFNIVINEQIDIFANRLLRRSLVLKENKSAGNRSQNINHWHIGLSAGVNSFAPVIAFEREKFTYQAGWNLYGAAKGPQVGVLYQVK